MSELIPTVVDGVVDSTGLRRVFARFPSGVTAICALDDTGRRVGMAASSFVSVSLEPPLVALCVQHTSTTWPRLRDRPRIGLSVLGDGQDRACRQLASKAGDRFADLDLYATEGGALLLHGATAWMDCSIESTVPAGDHDVVLLRVHRQRAHLGHGPLVFHESGFHALARRPEAS